MHGFDSEKLIEFGIKPRKPRGRDRKPRTVRRKPAAAEETPLAGGPA